MTLDQIESLKCPAYRAVARLLFSAEKDGGVLLSAGEVRALISLRDVDSLAKDLPYLMEDEVEPEAEALVAALEAAP